MRVAFAGTPAFARTALQSLHGAGFAIPLVLTQPDRPAGRGLKLQPSPVKQFAVEHAIAVAQPQGLKLDGRHADDARAAQAALQAAQVDACVVAAYGLILPRWLLNLPRLGCLNIHASLLPRWRGAAPVQRAIQAGDARTGVTIMQMDEGLDTGDMLLVEPLAITADDTAATLTERLAALGARLVVEALELAARGGLRRTPQPADGISYAHKITKDEAPIDWTQPAEVLERQVRAFDPFPGASFALAGQPMKLWRAAVVPNEAAAAPGTVLRIDAGGPVVACGAGALQLQTLQRAGGRRLPAAEWLAGQPLPLGTSIA
jgi:methionyl-tRNA formyltransferase